MRPILPDGISAVLPAFNESAVIEHTVRATHQALRESGVRTCEVIVVDDGSSDGTRDECLRLAAELPAVRLISHSHNLGYGAALRTGFDAARMDAVFLMDSDGQFDPADISRLLQRWDGHSAVCGYREHRSDPAERRLFNAAFFAIVNARFGRSARDINCGFKLFPAALGRGLQAEGALISTELVLRARESSGIVDVAVRHSPRRTGTPTGAKPSVVMRAFGELWRLDRRRRRARHMPIAVTAATHD